MEDVFYSWEGGDMEAYYRELLSCIECLGFSLVLLARSF
jgi:hypothetical protein